MKIEEMSNQYEDEIFSQYVNAEIDICEYYKKRNWCNNLRNLQIEEYLEIVRNIDQVIEKLFRKLRYNIENKIKIKEKKDLIKKDLQEFKENMENVFNNTPGLYINIFDSTVMTMDTGSDYDIEKVFFDKNKYIKENINELKDIEEYCDELYRNNIIHDEKNDFEEINKIVSDIKNNVYKNANLIDTSVKGVIELLKNLKSITENKCFIKQIRFLIKK